MEGDVSPVRMRTKPMLFMEPRTDVVQGAMAAGGR